MDTLVDPRAWRARLALRTTAWGRVLGLPGVLAFVMLCVATSSAVVVAAPTSLPAAPVAHMIPGVSMGFYEGSQDPNLGGTISVAQIQAHIDEIAPYTQAIRTFACVGFESVGAYAHKLGRRAAIGAWISTNATASTAELNCLIARANAGEVDLAIVGSEALLRSDVSESQLLAYMATLRAQAPGVQVTTADTYAQLLAHPAVMAASDVIFANMYGYWEGVTEDSAVAALNEWYGAVVAAAGGKRVIVSETGWPSCGNSVGGAVPSPANASSYFLNVDSWARATGVEYYYFESRDELWKARYEGPQGACWGLLTTSGTLKPGMQDVFDGKTMPDNWSNRVPGGPGAPSIQVTQVSAVGVCGTASGQVLHVNVDDYRVVIYLHVPGLGWWVKPTFANPITLIGVDGSWSAPICTGGEDALADQVVAAVFPAGVSPALLGGGSDAALTMALSPAVTSTSVARTAAVPAFSPPPGTYTEPQQVSISDATPGAIIYYTVDGTAPSPSSKQYSGPLNVDTSQTIQAIAVRSGYPASAVATATYTIQPPAAIPTFDPLGGTYHGSQSVSIIDTTPGARIFYTTDGTIPTTGSAVYSGPIGVATSQTLQAIATASGFSQSAVASAAYTIVLPAASPTFNPPAGTYTGAQTVTISDLTPGASIFYTTDGSDPTATSTPYTGPIHVSASETLRAIAFAPSDLPSAVTSATYTIVFACGAPVLNMPVDGAVQSSDSVIFGWQPLADCTFSGYVVRIKNVASMDSGGLTLVDTVVPTAQYATTLSSANENMDLFWGVRAANPPAGATWTVRRFRIARVQVGVTRNPPAPPQRPALTASLTARSGCGAIQSILFGPPGRPLANAVVTILPAGPQFTGTSRYVPPPGTTQVSFLVERSAAAGGATVPLVLSDSCGDWESLVGGGADAFK